jgi:uncharacterized membrane protein YbhN (UPF0104 family)
MAGVGRRALASRLLPVGGGIVVLALLAVQVGTGPFLRGLDAVTPTAVAAVVALTALATTAAAWRWRTIARALDLPLPWPTAFAEYYRSQFVNTVLPGGVGGDVHRAIVHGRAAGTTAQAARAVVAERAAGQIVQVALAAVVLTALGFTTSPATTSWVFAVALVVAALAAAVGTSRRARRAAARELVALRTAFAAPATIAVTIAASIVVVAAHTLSFVVACLAVGVRATPRELMAVALVSLLAASIPVNIGGWGPRETAASWAFAAVGLGADAGVAASTTFGVLTTLAVLPGALVVVATAIAARRAETRVVERVP